LLEEVICYYDENSGAVQIKPLKNSYNIVLVEPEIPPNTGTVARLCGATDSVLHLVKPLGFSTDDKHLKRAGLDYWKYVVIRYWDTIDQFLGHNPVSRMHFFTTKTERSYTACRFRPGDFLVFGKETRGLDESLLKRFPQQCHTIPMSNPNIRSINLSICAGIVLYEALRQCAPFVTDPVQPCT